MTGPVSNLGGFTPTTLGDSGLETPAVVVAPVRPKKKSHGIVTADLIEAIQSGITRHTRRIEFYESDGITPWNGVTVDDGGAQDTGEIVLDPRVISGGIAISQGSDSRRNLDLVLDNSDGKVDHNPDNGLWYDKIIKVYRGINYQRVRRAARVAVVGQSIADVDRVGPYLGLIGMTDITYFANPALADIYDYDIVVAYRRTADFTAPISALLWVAYLSGMSVMTFNAYATPTSVPLIATLNTTFDYSTPWTIEPPSYDTPVSGSFRLFTRTVSTANPTLSRKNLCTNPGGEVDATGWVAGGSAGGTATSDATRSHSGSNSIKAWIGTGGTGTAFGTIIPTLGIQPLTQYTISVWVYNPASSPVGVAIRATGAGVTSGSGTTVNTRDAWVRVSITLTTLAGASDANVNLFLTRGAAGSGTYAVWADDALVEASGTVNTFFDGAASGAPAGHRYLWDGTAQNSTSSDWDYSSVPETVPATLASGAFDATNPQASAPQHPLIYAENSVGGRWLHYHSKLPYPFLSNLNATTQEERKMLRAGASWLFDYQTNIRWETQVGEFMIDRIDEPNFPHQLSVTGRDYSKKLDLDRFTQPTTYSAGMFLVDVIQAIVYGAGITRVSISIDNAVLTQDIAFDRDTSKLDALKQVAESFAFEWYFDRFGVFIARPFLDPTTSPVTLRLRTGVAGGNLASYSKSSDDTELFNVVVVVGENADGSTALFTIIKSNDDPNSPTSTVRVGRRVYTFTSAFLTDYNAGDSLASALLAVKNAEAYQLDFASLLFPWVEVGEITEFTDPMQPDSAFPTRFLLTDAGIPLDLTPMSGTGKRVAIV